jgi:uncharacterized protein YvpB
MRVILPIKLLKQKRNSDDCLRCAFYMAMHYLDSKLTQKDVWERLRVYKKNSGLWGAYFVDAGVIAISEGFESKIYHSDWKWWDKKVVQATKGSKKSLLKALTDFRKTKKKQGHKLMIDKEIDFVKAGGKFISKIPSTKTIDAYLENRTPVIISVSGADLDENPKHDWLHAILIYGMDGDNYLIHDPYIGTRKENKEKVHYAWCKPGGWMLVIE